ncbi:hypothetical protein Tco_1456490 [Tanacetum coccineum]
MWEEFTQSIHTFTEDNRNLAQHTLGKKKATFILIPSIRFTKLIIFHQQRLHNFYQRPESPLHLPTEEPVLGHLKFSAKGSKREVFRMTIPNELINDVIRGADYYDVYMEKVAKHQRYIAGEELSDPDSPAPKPAKPKRAKAGKVVKKRTVKSSKQLVDEFIDEGVPAAMPRLEDTEEEILQKFLEESLTNAYPTQRGPLRPMVFRETDTRERGKRNDTESDEQMPSVVRSGAQDEGHAGPDPGTLDEGQDGPNPDGDWVCCNPNLSTPSAAYPDVQENLKLTVDEQVIPEEPVSSTGPIVHLCLPPMTSPVIGPVPRPDSPNVHWPLPTTTTTTAAQQQTTLPLPPSNHTREAAVGVLLFHRRLGSERSNDSVIGCGYSYQYACIERVLFRARFKDSPTSDMMGNSAPTMLEEDYDKGHANHRVPIQGRLDTGASDSAQAPPPPPPSSSTHQGDQSTSTAAPSSSKTVASAEYSAWTMTDTRIKPSITTIPDDLYMDDETTADEQAYSSGDEVGRDHIPTVNLRQSWWKPLTEDRPATPEPAWTIPSSDLTMPTNNWASALKSTYAPPQENSLLAQTGDMAIFMDWPCNHSTGLLLQQRPGYHDMVQGWQRALSISKMKAAYYPDVGLEQLVPDQFWIEAECKYDIAAMYAKSFLWNGYNYMKKIVLRRAGLKEYVIAEKDFKYMCPSDFEDLLNLTKPRWEATGFEFKHDYTVIDSPRAVIFRDKYGGSDDLEDETPDFGRRKMLTEEGLHVRFQKRTKDKRYLRNLECWLGVRIREGDYRSYKDGKVRYSLPQSRQNRRDLPRDNPLVSVEVLRSVLTDSEINYGGNEIPRSVESIPQPHAHS